jgi:N-acetylmuramic acid 6-phosphate etherase
MILPVLKLAGRVLAVDLGKTTCRVGLVVDGALVDSITGPGAPGLAEPTGVTAAAAAIAPLAHRLRDRHAVYSPIALGIGAAGAAFSVDGPRRLAAAMRAALGVGAVMVASDAITAHVGALAGLPGVVQLAGTGAVAVGIAADGRRHLVDGWGPWLGDEGSGGWIGLAGLRAAVRAHDGRGRPTALLAAAVRRFGKLTQLPTLLAGDDNPARMAASFAPDVVLAAQSGDSVALELLSAAGAALASGTLVAVRAIRNPVGTLTEEQPTPVALIGGLSAPGDGLLEHWRAALAGSPVDVVTRPAADALVGAAMLALRTDLPHEPVVHRSAVGEPFATKSLTTGSYSTGSYSTGPYSTGPYSTGPHVAEPLAAELHSTEALATTPVPAGPVADILHTDNLPTEQVRPGLEDLDTWPARELVELLLGAEAIVPSVLAEAAPALARAVELTVERLHAGGRLVYVGAGTPGRLAALDAAEVGPTFSVPPGTVVSVIAGGFDARINALEGAEDDDRAGAADLASCGVGKADVVVGVSASGRTPYVLGALTAAREAGAATAAIVNNPGSPIAAAADVAVEICTGAEVIAGSTRLTAGTAQKIVLNVLSTAAMVRLGRTFGAWMVDVQAGNHKLRRRALRILREATGADSSAAERALADAGGETRTALVALLLDVDTGTARARLATAGDRVRDALHS